MSTGNLTDEKSKELVCKAWWAGVEAVNGYALVLDELSASNAASVTHVLAIGKAAAAMMSAASEYFQDDFKGLVITKYDHLDKNIKNKTNINWIESAHPVPDENSMLAGQQMSDFVSSLTKSHNLLVLVSGGASALAEKLGSNMTLTDLQTFNNSLLSENKTIAQINAARSEISLIKKGRLLNQCNANSILTLAISDVQGDDVMVIGSGIGGCELPHANAKVIGSNAVARNAIGRFLQEANIDVVCNNESLYGELFNVSQTVAKTLINGPSGGYIFGGESVVELPENPGRGGRNQSLALAIAKHLTDLPGIIVLAAGSDGTDGPTQAAGGIVDCKTFSNASAAQLALDQANAGKYLKGENALFVTGPTGTNVMDLLVAIKY